jgi:hypothetical protein
LKLLAKLSVDDSHAALEIISRSSYVPGIITQLASDPGLSGDARAQEHKARVLRPGMPIWMKCYGQNAN